MADYYPLIARAVEGLADKSQPMRHAVFERARTALLDQLRSLDPPLADADIRRECLALDDAIARVEADYDPDSAKPTPPAQIHLPGAAAVPVARPAPLPSPAPVDDKPSFEAHLPETDDPPVHEDAVYEEPAPARPRVDSRSPVLQSTGQSRAIVLGVVLALVIGVIAVAAWMLRDTPVTLATAPPVATAPQAPPTPDRAGKIDERIGGPAPAQGSSAAEGAGRQEVGVAQRAIFYEEDPANPQLPKEIAGRAVWRLEGVNAGQGQPLETAVRAVIEFPDAGLTMTMLLRRNLDSTLPASHTIELNFTSQPGQPGRVVRDVGLLQFKNDMRARGTPIAGLPVPVRENLFLIGLSNLNTDVERNIELLVHRNWIDLPIRTVAGQRAIISFEKGVAGEQVMRDAFRQWQ
jgi:hypothetical protein